MLYDFYKILQNYRLGEVILYPTWIGLLKLILKLVTPNWELLNEQSEQDLKWCRNIFLDENWNQAEISTVIQATSSCRLNSQPSRDRRVSQHGFALCKFAFNGKCSERPASYSSWIFFRAFDSFSCNCTVSLRKTFGSWLIGGICCFWL